MGNMISPTVVLDHVTKRTPSDGSLRFGAHDLIALRGAALRAHRGRVGDDSPEVTRGLPSRAWAQWAGTPFTFVAGNPTAHRQALDDLRT